MKIYLESGQCNDERGCRILSCMNVWVQEEGETLVDGRL